ncbi:SDR family NAD(P)-dependent oxidoreductase, partial [Lactiplantibacillus plantarum]|uniref:SDR family NAD(P)-dependent oxidoreductase n=1 Tax=Lactiplantibacillus plantarum TaxID=1590 RepID=UPI0039C114F1
MTTTTLSQPQLDGRTVLITGGTSGIGLAAALQAKAAGAAVIIVGSNRERAAQVTAEHDFAGWRAADVSQLAEIEAAFTDLPHVDHLVLL